MTNPWIEHIKNKMIELKIPSFACALSDERVKNSYKKKNKINKKELAKQSQDEHDKNFAENIQRLRKGNQEELKSEIELARARFRRKPEERKNEIKNKFPNTYLYLTNPDEYFKKNTNQEQPKKEVVKEENKTQDKEKLRIDQEKKNRLIRNERTRKMLKEKFRIERLDKELKKKGEEELLLLKKELNKKEVVKKEQPKKEVVKKEQPKKQSIIFTDIGPSRLNKSEKAMINKQSQRTNETIIIDNWDDPFLGYVVDNNDKKLMDDITTLIDKKNRKNETVIDIYLLAFTKKYNDDIINKYGFDVLFNGINTLANHYGAENYIQTYDDKSSVPNIPKGYMNEKNRMLLFNKFKNKDIKKEQSEIKTNEKRNNDVDIINNLIDDVKKTLIYNHYSNYNRELYNKEYDINEYNEDNLKKSMENYNKQKDKFNNPLFNNLRSQYFSSVILDNKGFIKDLPKKIDKNYIFDTIDNKLLKLRVRIADEVNDVYKKMKKGTRINNKLITNKSKELQNEIDDIIKNAKLNNMIPKDKENYINIRYNDVFMKLLDDARYKKDVISGYGYKK